MLRPMYQQVKEIAFISQRSRKLDKCISRQVDYKTYKIQSATVQNKLKTKKSRLANLSSLKFEASGTFFVILSRIE